MTCAFERHELRTVACLLGCFDERRRKPERHLIVIGPMYEDLPDAEWNPIARRRLAPAAVTEKGERGLALPRFEIGARGHRDHRQPAFRCREKREVPACGVSGDRDSIAVDLGQPQGVVGRCEYVFIAARPTAT